MNKTPWIWKNGELIPWEQATTHVLTHSLHYGSGVFEGIRVYETPDGPQIFKLPEHVDRLIYSAESMGMAVPFTKEALMNAIEDLAKTNQLKFGYIRPLIYYGYGEAIQVSPPKNLPIDVVIACWPSNNYLPVELIDMKTSDIVRISPKAGVMNAKICGQYANSLLAGLCIRNTHYHEVLLLDEHGFVAEGAAQNIFIVKDGVLYTPPAETVLPGITRLTVMEMAQALGIDCFEVRFEVDAVYDADEAFLTGSAAEITAIRSLDDQIIGSGKCGEISAQLRAAYQALTHQSFEIATQE